MLGDLIASQGHFVLQADGGRAALALLEGGATVDLVLTDLGMPEMTGWDVARAIRSRWPRLPVAMLTGWGNDVDVPAANSELIIGMLAKPVTDDALEALISRQAPLTPDALSAEELSAAPAEPISPHPGGTR